MGTSAIIPTPGDDKPALANATYTNWSPGTHWKFFVLLLRKLNSLIPS